jgi:hypothetical protein
MLFSMFAIQLERQYETLIKTVRSLEGDLADYNLAMDKSRTGTVSVSGRTSDREHSHVHGMYVCVGSGRHHPVLRRVETAE